VPDRTASSIILPPPLAEKVGFSGNDEIPQVFDTNPTKPLTSWKVAWTTARNQVGLLGYRFHDLRHTVVTRLLERGQAFAVVAEIMGWSPGTTVRMVKRYGHIGPSARRAAMATLDITGEKPAADSPQSALVDAPTTIQ